jgi:uncharacterized protein
VSPASITCAPGYKDFFRHIAKPMETMARLLRAGQAPAELMAIYAAQDSRRGRNDPCPCGNGRKWKRCHGAPHLGYSRLSPQMGLRP